MTIVSKRTEQVKNCPICGKDNDCGNIAGKPHGSCWCSNEFFPKKIFDHVPSDQLGKSCICKDCLAELLENE